MESSAHFSQASLAIALMLAMLAGCDQRDRAPDTAVLGAGAASDCGLRTDEALQRINAARAGGRSCGARFMPPAPPLQWDDQLDAAAAGHSVDMARRNYFEHRSPAGSTVSERVSAAHYHWKSVGENLAGGDRSIAEAVQGWLESPAHCENLMDPRFVDVAVACVAQPGSQWGTYWTMVLGRRQ